MLEYSLNMEKSKELYKQHKRVIKQKECYNNVFRVISAHWNKLQSGEWKVAYGYMTLLENLLCRHCFVLDENNEVLDPTIFTHTLVDAEKQYFVMKLFNDPREYLEALEWEEGYPALSSTLHQCEKSAWNWAMENGFILTG